MVNCEFSSLELYELLESAYPEMKDWTKSDVEEIRKHLFPDAVVLDAGCGWGRAIKSMAPFCSKIEGIDIDAGEIGFAKKYLAAVTNVSLHVQNMKATSFANESFDIITCIGNTFGNLATDKEPVLQEMKRLIKKDGKIIISVYSQESNTKRAEAYKKIGFAIERIAGGQLVFENGYISEGFSDETIKTLMKKNNLKADIKKVGKIGTFIVATHC